jgi:hypothetical protein
MRIVITVILMWLCEIGCASDVFITKFSLAPKSQRDEIINRRGPNIYFARAMSLWEYELWVEEGTIIFDTEWIDIEEKHYDAYTIKFLKEEWVDARVKRRMGDTYDIIIGIRAEPDEFLLNDRISPARYINKHQIPISRVRIIYDPRKTVVPGGVDLDLDDPVKLLRREYDGEIFISA